MWFASLIVGLLLLGGGAFMAVTGIAARNGIREQLRAERLLTAADTANPGHLRSRPR